MAMAYKGKYKVKNRVKYKGDPTKIIYRSSWERNFMVYCDTNPNILQWASEEIVIPYRSPIDRKIHRYYPDFWIKVKKHDGKIRQMLIEIKPKKQTKPPVMNKNKKGRYLNEVKTWGVNQAKWEAAAAYCNIKDWTFKLITEHELKV